MIKQDKKIFFEKMLCNAKMTDMEMVKKVYYAFLKTIAKDLRRGKAIEAPDLGLFEIIINKPYKFGRNPKTGELIDVPERKVVKFRVNKNLKDFCK